MGNRYVPSSGNRYIPTSGNSYLSNSDNRYLPANNHRGYVFLAKADVLDEFEVELDFVDLASDA